MSPHLLLLLLLLVSASPQLHTCCLVTRDTCPRDSEGGAGFAGAGWVETIFSCEQQLSPSSVRRWRGPLNTGHQWPELLPYLLSVITTAGGTTTDGRTDGDNTLYSRIVNILVALLLFLHQGYEVLL